MATGPADQSSAAHEAHTAPVPGELLSVLLEVRAHVDASAAQLVRMHAQLERLDARVSTLEQLALPDDAAHGAIGRYQPGAG